MILLKLGLVYYNYVTGSLHIHLSISFLKTFCGSSSNFILENKVYAVPLLFKGSFIFIFVVIKHASFLFYILYFTIIHILFFVLITKLLYLNIKKCFCIVLWNSYWKFLMEIKKIQKEAAPIIRNSLLECSMSYFSILPSLVLT